MIEQPLDWDPSSGVDDEKTTRSLLKTAAYVRWEARQPF
jgi:hypothetical protein